ncbi:YhdP family protein [Massilia horti]|uniref:TIGR02099 family protein n=1 Tax=Massilia horti TaxID=2562153 RepID=A0A4Y9T0R6_9BURK|nr:YhdP family protein [Massilia horti]TFW32742.1 TIGR02099 family protein [Massilia horti]
MHNQEPQAAGEPLALAQRWRRVRAVYRYANLASHHLLGFALKAALLVYFVLALLFLVLRYAVLPNIDMYKGDIERAASHSLGNRVTISRIYASWHGLHPNLFLGDLALHDRQGRLLLALPSVSATLSWVSVFAGEPRFESLEINRPELDVRRDAAGQLFVAGVHMGENKGGPGGADWLFRQREIVIREGTLHWTDESRGAPPLALQNLTMALQNRWNTHRFALKATPPAELSQPLDVRARFTHPFGAHASDASLWRGELYVDLRDADLAAWKRYFDYPFLLERGSGSVRAWLALDQARLAGFTADVGLTGVWARLAHELPPLELARVSGRLSAREELVPGSGGGKPTFGAHGHTFSLSDFSITTREGVQLPPATLSETWRPAAGKTPESISIEARQVDLAALAELAAQLPMTPLQRAMLADYAPRGQLLDFSAQWQGHYPDIGAYRIKGKVADLSIEAQPAHPGLPAANGLPALPARPALPGFANLSGSIDATEKGGSIVIDSNRLALSMPAWFAEPTVPFDRFALQARWHYAPQDQLQLEVDKFAFAQGALHGSLSGRHTLPLAAGHGPGVADFTGTIDGLQINEVGRFLPQATPEHLHEWLTGALQGGTLRSATLRLRGDLAHFPFRADHPAERAAGEFRVAGRIAGGVLEYSPAHKAADGKSPLWPLAEQINGSIVFDRARMEIRGDTLRTMGIGLSNVKAVIPDLTAHEQMLEIDGSAAGALQDYLRYVAQSPVHEWIGGFTEEARTNGNARLGLKLRLPLAHMHDAKVQGVLQLQGNDVQLYPDLPPVQAAGGRIEFTEHGVLLNGVSGSFLGAPLALSGGTQRDHSIVVRLAGVLSADGIRRTAPEPALQRLGKHMSGSTRYGGTVMVKDHQLTVSLDSNLAGLGLELPAPLNKAQPDALPLRFVLTGAPGDESGLARQDIRVGLGQAVAARYLREKHGSGPWVVQRGGVGVNVPAPEPDSGMMINVNMKSLNVDQWLAAAADIAGKNEPAPRVEGTASGPDLAQYFVPNVMAARASELIVSERKLVDVVVGASHQKDTWQASINSRQASGYVTWDEGPSGQGLGKVTARLATLFIPESEAAEVKDLLESNRSSTTIPALDIVAERFELFNKKLGRLELAASNAQVPVQAGREWRIDRLALTTPDGALNASGRWVTKDGKSNTGMHFNLDIKDGGRLLDRLGFPETLRHGKGHLAGDISWNGLPYSLDIPSLSGQIQMNVEDGQFLKQDPGAAKLLGVLSLQMLPRMLKLDFHDVFSEGLAFDAITANASISRGVAKTDNLKMRGVAATVLMDGTADIAHESTNLHVVVIPEFNLGTGPLVYGLAVNPVIGLGSFLAQLFLRAPVMKALTYEMQVTGPWKSPTITKLDHRQAQERAAAVQPQKE